MVISPNTLKLSIARKRYAPCMIMLRYTYTIVIIISLKRNI